MDTASVTEGIKQSFKAFDKDGDGTISKEELKDIFSTDGWGDEEIDALFAGVDSNKDGKISYEEFLEWVMKDYKAAEGEVAEGAVAVVNESKRREAAPHLHQLFSTLKQKVKEMMSMSPEDIMKMMMDADAQAAFEEKQKKFTEQADELVDKSFKHHDVDASGALSKEEAAVFFDHFMAEAGAALESLFSLTLRVQIKAMTANMDVSKSTAEVEAMKAEIEKQMKEAKAKIRAMYDDYKKDKAARDIKAFEALDVNKDGTLQIEEFKAVLGSVFMGDLGNGSRAQAFCDAIGIRPP